MEFAVILLSAVVLDLILGDPKWLPMLVVYIGRVVSILEKYLRGRIEDKKRGGLLLAIIIIGGTYLIIFVVLGIVYKINRQLGILVSIYLLFNAISIKEMAKEAKRIAATLEKIKLSYQKIFWLKNARKKLSNIVGRDTHNLDEEEIARATIESIAESITDGVISPLFYMFLGGVPLCWAYKAVNTLDSMVGYKNEEYRDFGYFSAKIDDVANYIPARIAAFLLILVAFLLRKNFLRCAKTILRDGRNHPSPNSGLSEAGIAGALGIRLGGGSYYQGVLRDMPDIGEEIKEIKIKHIKESIVFLYVTSFLMVIILLIMRIVIWN
ncbi:MAG: adenosylcobinamide-phosphate synthase CbiB [bacterium]|nr:adenosylcobinamide-phosphate synthase CbiB [bacterium]